jgi:hypothetical protein
MRVWLAVFALLCIAWAAAAYFTVGPRADRVFEGCLAGAVIASLGAALPIPYAARASLAVAAGLALLVFGVMNRGPLAPIGGGGIVPASAALIFVTALPPSLLFRARYRAFKAARTILTVALVVSVPALVFAVLTALDGDAPLGWRIANGVLAASVLTGLFGYMGEETTGLCAQWAAVALLVYAARVAVGALEPSDVYGRWGYAVAAAGTIAASTLAAYGLFQVLASLFAERARAVNVHKVAGQPSLPSDSEALRPED